MPKVEFDISTDVAPDLIHAALINFGPDRPRLWPGVKASAYEVYEVGDTSAEIREDSGGMFWARVRYDWSTPGRVQWTVVDSGYSTPGDYSSADIKARDGGGSIVHIVWRRRGRSLRAKLAVGLMALTRGAPVRSSFEAGLKEIAKHPELAKHPGIGNS